MLIRSQQTLPLARMLWQLFIFKYNFEMHWTHSALRNYTKKEPMFHRLFPIFKLNEKVNSSVNKAGQIWSNYIGSKREIPSLSNQPSVYSFSLKVAWSGISLIRLTRCTRNTQEYDEAKVLHFTPAVVHNTPKALFVQHYCALCINQSNTYSKGRTPEILVSTKDGSTFQGQI